MIRFSDEAPIGRTRKTKEGFLVAKIKVARTGVQHYRAFELGDVAIAAGFDAMDIVRVNRPESEVFSTKALASISHAPLTVDHPPVMVDADNWSEYAVGEVGEEVLRDGQSLVASVIAKDARGIEAIKTTHKQVSMGYQAKLRDAEDKNIADFDMYDFEYNHISAVPAGRAGPEYGFSDSAHVWGARPVTVKDDEMTVELKTVILGDKAVQVEAKDAATVAAIIADHDTIVKGKDAEIGALTAKLADAEAKVLSDEGIAKLVDARVEENEKRAKVKAVLGDKADTMSLAELDGALAVIGDANVVDNKARDVLKDAKPIEDSAAKIKAAQNKFLYPEIK